MLRKALDAYSQKNYKQAQSLLTNLADSPDKTLLNALISDGLGERERAFEFLEQGILKFNHSDQLLLKLCQLRKKYGQHALFISFLESNRLHVNSKELAHSYLALLVDAGLLRKAMEFDTHLSDDLKKAAGYIWYRAELYKQRGELDEAITILKSALTHYPSDFHLNYRLANFLQEAGRPIQALNIYEKLIEIQPNSPELNYAIACSKYSLEDYTQTKLYLDKTLALAPNYVPAHESYSKLMWALNDKDNLLLSYQKTRHAFGAHPQVIHSEVGQLLRVNEVSKAHALCEQAVKLFGHIPEIQHMHSVVLDKMGETTKALQVLEELSRNNPYHTRINLDLANHYLQQNELHKVEPLLNKPLQVDSDNQEIWAYLSVTWRLLGDERFLWLNNYDQIIGQYELPTPEGYNSLDSFLADFKTTLNQLHAKEKNQPLDQSVRHGTQTDGHLLAQHNSLVYKFKQSFERCLNDYLSRLPNDNLHPLYRRNTGHYKANGSWSVKLDQGGFHTNHIHPRGWISGPSYISIPEQMSSSDPTRSGWLKLGETCLGLGEREHVDMALCPSPGLLVFFPSYVWHGTYALTQPGARMTVPCDILPIQ